MQSQKQLASAGPGPAWGQRDHRPAAPQPDERINHIPAVKAGGLAEIVLLDLVTQGARDPVHGQGVQVVGRVGKAIALDSGFPTAHRHRKVGHGHVAGGTLALDHYLKMGIAEDLCLDRCSPVGSRAALAIIDERHKESVDTSSSPVRHLGVADGAHARRGKQLSLFTRQRQAGKRRRFRAPAGSGAAVGGRGVLVGMGAAAVGGSLVGDGTLTVGWAATDVAVGCSTTGVGVGCEPQATANKIVSTDKNATLRMILS